MMYLARLAYLVLFLAFLRWSKERKLSTDSKKLLQSSAGCNPQRLRGRVEVFITVSSFSIYYKNGRNVTRQLEINWYGKTPRKGDSVALYDQDPTNGTVKPLASVDPTLHPDGFFRTDVEFPYMYFDLSHLAQHPCLGYWAGYIESGKVVSSTCLQMRPFWMGDNIKYLQDQRLSEIMIPGSHDSGCFCPYLGQYTDTLMRYKYSQEEPIFNQLVYGIRYFDLRVGYYEKSRDKYYINHSFFRTDHSVASILAQVKSFLAATNEIVILDFHLFPVGFENMERHKELMGMVFRILDPYLIPYNAEFLEAPIGYLMRKNKRDLVADNDTARHFQEQDVLWPGIPRAWGNKQQPEDLKLYFESVFSKPVPKGLWASMAELTPNSRFIVRHPKKGLRQMADEVNRNVTRWFREKYWQKANIVATDYFLGNNVIDVAIDTNKLKAFCRSKHSGYSYGR